MKYRIALWGSAGFLVAGFWGTFCLRNLPSNKRTTEGSLGSRELNLPGCDSWQVLPH